MEVKSRCSRSLTGQFGGSNNRAVIPLKNDQRILLLIMSLCSNYLSFVSSIITETGVENVNHTEKRHKELCREHLC